LRSLSEITEPHLHSWPTSYEELRTLQEQATAGALLANNLGAGQ
jgi:hypothetical protein